MFKRTTNLLLQVANNNDSCDSAEVLVNNYTLCYLRRVDGYWHVLKPMGTILSITNVEDYASSNIRSVLSRINETVKHWFHVLTSNQDEVRPHLWTPKVEVKFTDYTLSYELVKHSHKEGMVRLHKNFDGSIWNLCFRHVSKTDAALPFNLDKNICYNEFGVELMEELLDGKGILSQFELQLCDADRDYLRQLSDIDLHSILYPSN